MANPFAVGVALSSLLDLRSSTRKKQPKLKFPKLKLRTPERLKPYAEGSTSRKAMIKDE